VLTLDDADRKLIDLLADNGRISNRELGSRIGLTEVTIAARLRRLRESGVFRVGAVLDWAAAGYTFGLTFWINVESRDPIAVAGDLAKNDAVYVVGVSTGSVDIILYALASEYDDVEKLTRDFQRVSGVARVAVDLQYETVKYTHRYALLRNDREEFTLPAPVYALDDLDYAIIGALLQDAQVSNRMLARRIGSSEGTVRARLRRLEDANLLRIRGQVDPVLADELSSIAFVAVELDGNRDDEAIARMLEHRYVLSCTKTTGSAQLLLNLGAPDRASLADFIMKEVRAVQGVRAAQTWEIVRFVKMLSHYTRFI
jgi:Lrp/AsnC family transcriptional regulator for asnA, asnC and gidA